MDGAPEGLVQQRVELRWDRDRIWIEHRGHTVARYPRSYTAGTWQPAPRMRAEPPTVAPLIPIASPEIVPPALADYAVQPPPRTHQRPPTPPNRLTRTAERRAVIEGIGQRQAANGADHDGRGTRRSRSTGRPSGGVDVCPV